MSGIEDQHEIDELRKRLYARGTEPSKTQRHELSNEPIEVSRNWGVATAPLSATSPAEQTLPEKPRRYRKIVLIGSLAIFTLVAGLSGAYYYFGKNHISADNIAFTVAGNTNVSGGETISFQIGVTNQNTVAIEGATLIVKYPEGTRSVTEPVKDLFEERIDVGTLNPGEAKNIQLQVAVYGKENHQADINATLEYRIIGSDGTFYKDATPLHFQIVSSPIILQVSSVRRVSAGQPIEITLTAKSNTNKVLKDVLISAKYPPGFAFKNATPAPIYNQDVWKIDELQPEETETIKINGSITGLTSEGLVIDFSAGAAKTDNQFFVGSLLADARVEFVLEQPFIAVDLDIAGDKDGSVVIEQGKTSVVQVGIKNTLDESVYDMVVEVVPSGSALSASSIQSRQGFYDSNKGLVRWDVSNTPDFKQVLPGQERRLSFTIDPQETDSTASFNIAVNVYAKRVADASAQQQLVGTVTAEARYASKAAIATKVAHASGPVPPKVGQKTTYLVTLSASGGANNLTNTVISTSLPSYVDWNNEYQGSGNVTYNPVSRQVEWAIGDMNGGITKELTFSVGFLPSISQVGINPILVNDQTLTATDRFTNTPVTTTVGGVTTELSTGFQAGNGTVMQ